MGAIKFNDNARIDVTCPNCGHKWRPTLGELRKGVTCPECALVFETSKFDRGLRDLERKGFGL